MSLRNPITPATWKECLHKVLSPFWPSCQFLQPLPGTWIKDFRLSKTSSRSVFGRAYTPHCTPACQRRRPARSTWATRLTQSTRTSQSTRAHWSSNFLKSTYQVSCIVVSKGGNKGWMIGKRLRKRWVFFGFSHICQYGNRLSDNPIAKAFDCFVLSGTELKNWFLRFWTALPGSRPTWRLQSRPGCQRLWWSNPSPRSSPPRYQRKAG